jgi:asparagine synthase (glutamine-hydrolysing)
MCGLFGVVSTGERIDYELARLCLNKLAHRGPDQWGDWRDDRAYIGHRRLSIIDLSDRGRQPLADSKAGVVITVNGEIYNYKILRKELKSVYTFYSDSDSEVVLHGYKHWGIEGLLERLEGMYAFTIYDSNLGKVYLARDRLGIKPLYYGSCGGLFFWASELKAITGYCSDQLSVDNTSIYDFLTYRYIPAPKTYYKEIYKLEPGHYLELDLANLSNKTKRYWKLTVGAAARCVSERESMEVTEGLMHQSMQSHLLSDVPVNFFLSGGLDSSYLSSLASTMMGEINTFNIGFSNRNFDESGYANAVAKYINSHHHNKVIGQADSELLFSKMRDWYDEPFADFSAIPTYLVCKTVSDQGGKVAIAGDGADEVFGGYSWYFNDYVAESRNEFARSIGLVAKAVLDKSAFNSFPWRVGRYLGRRYIYQGFQLYSDLMGGLPWQRKISYRNYLEINADYDDYWFYRRYYRDDLPPKTRLQYLDIHTYLPEEILTKIDRVSMAVSLEVRVPYLCHHLLEGVFSLPEEIRYPKGIHKGLLKKIAESKLPKTIINRRKRGFGIPREYRRSSSTGVNIYEQEKVLFEHYKELELFRAVT